MADHNGSITLLEAEQRAFSEEVAAVELSHGDHAHLIDDD